MILESPLSVSDEPTSADWSLTLGLPEKMCVNNYQLGPIDRVYIFDKLYSNYPHFLAKLYVHAMRLVRLDKLSSVYNIW